MSKGKSKTKRSSKQLQNKQICSADQFRRKRPAGDSKKEKDKKPSDVLRSIVLKSKVRLEGDTHTRSTLISADHELVLRKLATIAPNIKKKGDSVSEVLNNALIDFYHLAKEKWKPKEMRLVIKEIEYNKEVEIFFLLPYTTCTEGQYSFELKRLKKIEEKNPSIISYIYTVINHLTKVNYVDWPNFKHGKEAMCREHIEELIACGDMEDEETQEASQELDTEVKELELLESDIKERKLHASKYRYWRNIKGLNDKEIQLLKVGEEILKDRASIRKFVHRESEETYPLSPEVGHRFFYSMNPNDQTYGYLSELYDAEYNENGAMEFTRKAYFKERKAEASQTDFPILLHKYLGLLWDVAGS